MTTDHTPKSSPAKRGVIVSTVSDIWVVVVRNLYRYIRQPQLLVFTVIQPVMFVLLFRYVFGGAISVPGFNYVDFLMPGIIVQSIAFGTAGTSVGLAEDIANGMIDRFRSLPMARSAVLAGRTIADTIRTTFTIFLMGGVGALVGFRIHTDLLHTGVAIALSLYFAMAFSWIAATIGLSVTSPEAAQTGGFVWLFPVTFASSAFVPVQTMPSWLQHIANANPITLTVNACRALTLGGPTDPVFYQALAWVTGIMLVFGPLAIRRYRLMSS